MKKSGYKNVNSSTTKKVVKKVVKKENGQKNGGCKCGCQAMTKSNCPDPFTTKTDDDKINSSNKINQK